MGKENLDDDDKSCGFSPFDLSSRNLPVLLFPNDMKKKKENIKKQTTKREKSRRRV